MKRFVVYAIFERKTRTCYIGQTSDFAERLNGHLFIDSRENGTEAKRRWLYHHAWVGSVELRIMSFAKTRREALDEEARCIERVKGQGWNLLNYEARSFSAPKASLSPQKTQV